MVGQQVFLPCSRGILAPEQDFALNPSGFLAVAWKPEASAPAAGFLFWGFGLRPVEISGPVVTSAPGWIPARLRWRRVSERRRARKSSLEPAVAGEVAGLRWMRSGIGKGTTRGARGLFNHGAGRCTEPPGGNSGFAFRMGFPLFTGLPVFLTSYLPQVAFGDVAGALTASGSQQQQQSPL